MIRADQSPGAMDTAWATAAATAGQGWSLGRVLAVHRQLMGAEKPSIAGVVRNGPVFAGNHTFMNSTEVPAAMAELLGRAAALAKEPSVQAAALMAGLLTIHPFMDGNGRTALILGNWILHQAGSPVPINFRHRDAPLASRRKGGVAAPDNTIGTRWHASLWAYDDSGADHDSSLMWVHPPPPPPQTNPSRS